jgi:futalosine hydrolase
LTKILLVAATELELCGEVGLVCGVGPVEAAAATGRALALDSPQAVLHIGVAGATGVTPGSLVVGTEAVYGDLLAEIEVVSRVEPDPSLLAAVKGALPDALALPIGTSATVGGLSSADSHRVRVEAMEGFAVLRACELAGVPAVEVRAISNQLGEANRVRWRLPRALEALTDALPALLSALRK